jgi:glycosyltransferase involved in cell wall biosynthesis
MGEFRVLHVMNSFVDSSISRIALSLVANLGPGDASWHVGAVTGLGGMEEEFERAGCRVIHFGGKGEGSPPRSLRRYVLEHDIDVVHAHTLRTILDVSYAVRGLSNVTHLATKHQLHARGDRQWGLAYSVLDRLTLYLPDLVIAVSNTMRNAIAAQPFVDHSKVVLIRNAIQVEGFYRPQQRLAARHELGLPTNATVLGCAGRIEKVKRFDLLLKAFREVLAQHADARLVIAGEGSLKAGLETLAATLGVAHAVTWPGFYPSMPNLLSAIDVYVQSSDNEGLPLGILEAMAAEKAVVATRVGGTGEVIADGETGILVRPGSPAAIAAAVLRLLDEPDQRATIAKAARVHVQSAFGLPRMVDEYGAVYASLAARRRLEEP